MKKLFLMMALAATALFTVTACGSDDDDNGGNNNGGGNGGVVTLTPPPYKNVAKAFIVKDNTQNIRQLRMMESGAYMIGYSGNGVQARITRGVDLVSYEFGKYTYSDGVFKFSNGMVITATPDGQDFKIVITWKNGTTIETTGSLDTSSSVALGVMTDNICSHAWTIESLKAVGVFSGVRAGREFSNPETSTIALAEVRAWFESASGKSLKDDFDDSAIIEGILFDGAGLFTINYTNRKDDVGTWRWVNMDEGTLRYSWNGDLSAVKLFTGDASVKFQKSPERCILTLKGKVDGQELEFIFTLK